MPIHPLNVAGVVALVALMATSAFAQTPRPERPYRGLFGGGTENAEQSLTLSGMGSVGYDSNALAGTRGAVPGVTSALPYGATNGASGSLAYGLGLPRLNFGASIGTGLSYYPGLANPFVSSQSAGLGASYEISKRTRLAAGESLSYQPYYALAAFPGLVDPALGQPTVVNDSSQSARLESHITSAADVSLSHSLSRRTAVSVSYHDYRSQSDSGTRDVSTQEASVGFSVSLAKGLSAYVGYGFSDTAYGGADGAPGAQGRSYNAGLNFDRALSVSLSRRVKLTFATGSTAVVYEGRTHFFVTGNANLNREIGRSWSATLSYVRSVDVIDTYRQPVVSDGLSASFGGLINRRLQFQSSAGASLGTVGFTAGNGFRAYYGSTGLTIGLTRRLGMGLDYSYYRYATDDTVSLPFGVSHQMDRQTVRAYVSCHVPLIHKARRSNAAR